MNLQAIVTSLWSPVQEMILIVWSYMPALVGAILVLIIGAWIAKILRDILITILGFLRLDDLADAVGLSKVLDKGGVETPLSVLIPVIAFWATMLGVLYSALNVLGITMLDKAAQLVLSFLPNVITAVFILIVGAAIAAFASAVIRLISSIFEFTNDDLLAGFTGYSVNVYAIMLALQSLRLGIDVVNNVLVIVIIAVGLSVALGLQGWAGGAVKAILTAKPKPMYTAKKKK